MEFNKTNLKEISKTVIEAVEEALKDSGITVTYGGSRYDSLEANLKIKLTTTSDDGLTSAERDFLDYAKFYELDPDMLGKNIKYAGKLFEVTGLHPNRRKNNISIKNVATGKTFIAPHTEVKRAYEGVAGAGITLE